RRRPRRRASIISRSMHRSLAITALIASTATAQQSPATFHQLGHAILRELIETNTTGSTGNTTIAAGQLATRFRDAGFPEADIQVVGPTPKNLNLTKPNCSDAAKGDGTSVSTDRSAIDPTRS